jgi:hypothetical protein
MYVMLVGSAGIKKSTAMSLARNLIRELKTIPIAPPSITKEAMTEYMAEEDTPCLKNFKYHHNGKDILKSYTHLSIFANELVTLINSGGNAMGMIEFLTDIFDTDEEFEVRTKNRGTDTIKAPYITVLACLTTETLSNLMNTKIISSGFSRRCIFVYSNDYGNPVPRPIVTQEQADAWNRCVQRGKDIQKLSGQFTWEPEAEEFWDDWYVQCHKQKEREDSEIRSGFLQTKPNYVLKIAALLRVSDSDQLIITRESLELALAFITEIEPDMDIVFAGAGRNELSPIAKSIEAMVVSSAEPIMLNRIHATFFKEASTSEINDILEHLSESNKIKLLRVTKDRQVLKLVARPDFVLKGGQP